MKPYRVDDAEALAKVPDEAVFVDKWGEVQKKVGHGVLDFGFEECWSSYSCIHFPLLVIWHGKIDDSGRWIESYGKEEETQQG